MTADDLSAESVLERIFAVQHQASRQQVQVPLGLRQDRLQRLQQLLDAHGHELAQAIGSDFGVRSPQLTEVADLMVLRTMLAQHKKMLPRWMRRQRVSTPLHLWPAAAFIERQALGVIGIIAPWNYPVQLALGPAISALAAGNRVIIKPSEFTPQTAQCLAQLVEQYFSIDEMAVVQGGANVASALAALPLDHLVFTGSTAVGRKVAVAAAANLTPTTLELGGKSPCIVGRSANLEQVALRVAHGKLLNAGQTCIAPDYVWLPREQETAFAHAYEKAVHQLFPTIAGNSDYAAIINERQWQRLQGLVQQAQQQGAQVQWLGSSSQDEARQLAPALLWQVQPSMDVMREEIFGPLLPVMAYDRIEDALAFINGGERPLALYWFGQDAAEKEQVVCATISGGMTVNDTLMHVAYDSLPFGGVGASGWGAYHGETGFLRFSHQKSVFLQAKWSPAAWLYPPYGVKFERIMALIKRMN